MMELLFLGLAGVVAWLWNRLDRLERDYRGLSDTLEIEVESLKGLVLREPHRSRPPEPMAEPVLEPEPEPEEERAVSAPVPAAQPLATPPAAEIAPEPESESDHEPEVAIEIDTPTDTETVHEDEISAYRPARSGFDFEDIFGRLLPIWAGGIALAIAGFFLVRWSIENGLLNETVRVSLGFAFGVSLLAAAEVAHRYSERLADPRVRQALAGAGLATLYASFYFAGSHYGLVRGGTAFAGLAGVTALAIALSYRFGLPSAVLGLLGGFAAPALAGAAEPNLPLLATYLALVTGGLVYTGSKQERSWLGLAALCGALGWGALMLATGPNDATGIIALGGYLVLVGTMLPALMGQGHLGKIGRIAACGVATLQIAALVDNSGYSLLAWGAYFLLAVAIAVLGWRNRSMRVAAAIAATLSVFMLAAWPEPADLALAAIAGAMAAIFAGAPLLLVVREQAEEMDWAQLAIYPLALVAALCIQLAVWLPFEQHMPLAFACFGLALAPAAAVWRVWPKVDTQPFAWPMAAVASSAILTVSAGLLATPDWAAPLVTAAVASGAFVLLREQSHRSAHALLWGLALMEALLHAMTSDYIEASRLIQEDMGWRLSVDTLRALVAALPFVLLMLRDIDRRQSWAAQVLAVVFGYCALAQTVPGDLLPTFIAAGALALAWQRRWRAGHATALSFGVLRALPALADWSISGTEALVGQPMMAPGASDRLDMLCTVFPLIVAWFGSLRLSRQFFAGRRAWSWAIGSGLALVLVHALFKAVFGIDDQASFVALGMAERTLWQAAIALPAIACLMLRERFVGQRALGGSLAAVALAHFGWFSIVLHNPLWDMQAVGPLPIANLLLLAYITAIALLVAVRSLVTETYAALRSVFDGLIMLLVAILFLSELRQVFSGTMLTAFSMTQQEDLLRSLLAIALALGFLGWGAWRGQRSWRIGSLVLMLLAVSKVFLFDAAGLEGLARIASFMALGICLIGIGWFYTRQLKGAGRLVPA